MRLLQSLPCARHVAVGLVEQVKVDIVHVKLTERRLNTGSGRFIAIVLNPELAGHKNVFSGNAAIPDSVAHFGFIEVGGSCVNVAVSCAQGFFDCVIGGTVIWNHEYPETNRGDKVAVVQQNVFHRCRLRWVYTLEACSLTASVMLTLDYTLLPGSILFITDLFHPRYAFAV